MPTAIEVPRELLHRARIHLESGARDARRHGHTILADERQKIANEIRAALGERTVHADPQHVCGLSGYNPAIDPPCPACVATGRTESLLERNSDGR